MFDFITDLDAYFCEKYANYDKLCVLPGYRMPKMQTSEVREDGRTYAYTLPANTMRLANQEDKAELLKELKKRMSDKTFSFSFRTVGIFTRIKNVFSKYAPHKWLKDIFAKCGTTSEEAGALLSIDKTIWKGICKGKYLPTKNLLFSLALTSQIGVDYTKDLFAVCGYEFDFTFEKDVVVSYLLEQKVYNRPMIDAALAEYKVTNLFLA
ncbi:MAG: hypothetical protein IJX91_02900 [Clostridia bacterium]|nr:hypothetical protein [Clostridia bacterium]